MADKEATTNSGSESSFAMAEAKSHTKTSNSPSDLEKGDLQAGRSQSPEKTTTAQDWTGPNDTENPQNW